MKSDATADFVGLSSASAESAGDPVRDMGWWLRSLKGYKSSSHVELLSVRPTRIVAVS